MGPDSQQQSVGLMWACSEGREKVVSRLLEIEEIFTHRFSLASCLMCAAKRNYTECVRLLLADNRVPVDTVNKDGLSPEEVTTNEEIRSLLREGHWKRVKTQVQTIEETVGLSLENIREFEEDQDEELVAKALELKNKEILKKVEMIESKEVRECAKLKKKYEQDKLIVQEKFHDETQGLRNELNKEILGVKSACQKQKQ